MQNERILVDYKGQSKGPLLIVFGGMHGNEPAGVEAIKLMGKMLDVEPITNPNFSYRGRFLGLIGNLKAYRQSLRFINKDLNRCWSNENVEKAKQTSLHELDDELQEIKEILEIIEQVIDKDKPEKVIVLDLHTTSSFGGIFTIVTDDEDSINIGVELHAPVIKGMLDGIQGTAMHFFNSKNFDLKMTPVTFESGQHNEELSINRAIAAITNCMRTIKSVSPNDVEHQHDKLLIEYSKDLPKVSVLINKHHIHSDDLFEMKPNFKNFQKIKKGEQLASDKNGPIYSPTDGLILMPLYQKQGEDGFFIISKVDF